MKKFEVTLTGHYEKPFPSMPTAPNRRRRKSKSFSLTPTLSTFLMRILSAAELIFRMPMRTDVKNVLPRTGIWRMIAVRTVRTSAPCVENVCMRTSATSNVLPSTEFGYPERVWKPNSLVRGCP